MKRMMILIAAAALSAGCRAAEASHENAGPAASSAAATKATSVVLVANLGEAEDECGCGVIIRTVRAAGARGVPMKEVDTRTSKDEAKKYRALVVPTVVLFDAAGNEVRRYEGESGDTIKKLKSDLDTLPAATK